MSTPRVVTAPRVRPVLEVAIGDTEVEQGQARYDAAHYDEDPTATYAGVEPLWGDDSCDVIDAVTSLGRQRSADVFDVGHATVTVRNPAGLWDYPPTDPSTVLSLRPGRMARVGVVVDDDLPVWLFTGWIDSTRPDYRPAAQLDTVVVDVVCAKGQFGRVELPELVAEVGAGETVTTRITRYANAAEFPTHRRLFDDSGITLIGTRQGGRAGELADHAATSAGGDVFGDEAGMLRYGNRDWRVRGTVDPIDGYIGNRGVAGEVCPNAWEVSFDRSDFTTRVNYGRVGDEPAALDDLSNRDRYGVETWDLTGLDTQDAPTVANLANRALRIRNFDLAPRIEACTLDAARPGVIELLAAASPFLPSAYSCGLVQAGRAVFARTLYLTGIEHTITAGAWTARLSLDDAAPWSTNPDTRYDTARYNQDRYARAV